MCGELDYYLLDELIVSFDFSSTTSLNVSWSLADSLNATNYTISYSNIDCISRSNTYDDIIDISSSEAMYTLTGLEEGTHYFITVNASLSDGETTEASLTATTRTAG